MSDPEAPTNTALLAACRVTELSYEDPEEEHGIFTLRLVQALCGFGETASDGSVSLNQVIDHLRITVPRHAASLVARNGGRCQQIPYFSQQGGGFLLGRSLASFIQESLAADAALPQWIQERARRFHTARTDQGGHSEWAL